MKVVYHIDEISKWNLLSANVRNTKRYDGSIDVVVVANAEAVKLFTDSHTVLEDNVSYHLCNNALKAHKISKESLIENVVIVDSGVIDLIKLQDKGYRYIKP